MEYEYDGIQIGLFEQAHSHKILFICGMDDGFDAWLNELLESDGEHADFLVDLAFCGSKTKEIVSCINRYCPTDETNEYGVAALLRAFWLRKYREDAMPTRGLAEKMYECWLALRELTDGYPDVGYGMSLMIDYACLVEEGVLDRQSYHQALVHYLETGTICDVFGMREHLGNKDAKKPFRRRFLHIFYKKRTEKH